MKKPNFFIVGAPKCGTTAMNFYLSQHPDIFMATKELHYFGADLQVRSRLSEQEYLQHFKGAFNKKIVGEASVWYLFSTTAAKEIKNFSPDVKILIMLRNPVDVVYSLHSQHLYDANEDVSDFETALALDDERQKGLRLARARDFLKVPSYKESALFSKQVKRYLEIFGRDNLHFVIYEDFITDAEKVVRGVFQFLGLDTEVAVKYDLINLNKKIQSFYLHRLMNHPSTLLRRAVKLMLPIRRLRHLIMTLLFRWNIRVKKREKMKSYLRASLEDFFTEDIQSLGQLIDRDLSAWFK